MWTDVNSATNWALVWLFGCLIGFFLLITDQLKVSFFSKRRVQIASFWIVIAVSLFVRLLPMIWLPVGAGFDIVSFQLVADAFLNGEEVYTSAAIGRHPYLPFQMYFITLSMKMALTTGLPFVVLIKVVPVLADVGITAVIFKSVIQLKKSERQAFVYAFLYALNPISILTSAYHGQFDSVAVLLLLLGWYFWQQNPRFTISSIFTGFAILNKTWPIVMLPLMIIRIKRWRDRLSYSIFTLLIPVLFTMAYIVLKSADPAPMLRRALTHSGNSGFWGHSAILFLTRDFLPVASSLYDFWLANNRVIILIVGLFVMWATRHQPVIDALVTAVLAVFSVTMGIGIQWLLWVVPFAIIADDIKWMKWYSVSGMIFLLVQLYGLHMVPGLSYYFDNETSMIIFRLGSVPAWVTTVLWTGSRLHRCFVNKAAPEAAAYL